MFLVDASVWVAAKDADDRFFDAAQALVLDTKRPLACLDLTLYETANVVCASEHSLTAYDAAYVAVAQRYGWHLISTDIADLVSKGLAVAPDQADYS